jgi:hypothetical protein
VTQENGQLEARLEVTKVALHTAEEEACTARAWLAKADAMVVGKFYCSDPLFLFLKIILLTTFWFPCLPALMVQLENLQVAANAATAAVNDRGAFLINRMHDIPERA